MTSPKRETVQCLEQTSGAGRILARRIGERAVHDPGVYCSWGSNGGYEDDNAKESDDGRAFHDHYAYAHFSSQPS